MHNRRDEAGVSGDADWLVPGTVLTLASAAIAFTLMSSVAAAGEVLTATFSLVVLSVPVGALVVVLSLMMQGTPHPLRELKVLFAQGKERILVFVLACGLCFANVTVFQIVKQLLNAEVPFAADRLLADSDRQLFLGHDPWTLLSVPDGMVIGLFYHEVSMAVLVLVLAMVLTRRASPTKSALMMTYLALWSLVGPLIHICLPAAGPLFYHQLGLGDRFAGLRPGPETQATRDYLWQGYLASNYRPGGGISAMPSMHVALVAWMVVAIHQLARRWLLPMVGFAAAIWILSVALGWHYALDGLIGGVAAIAVYAGFLAVYRGRTVRKTAMKSPDPA